MLMMTKADGNFASWTKQFDSIEIFLLCFSFSHLDRFIFMYIWQRIRRSNNLGNFKESSTMLNHENLIMWCQKRGFLAQGTHMMDKVINWSFHLTIFNQSKLKLVFRDFFEENQGQILSLSWWHEDDNWSCWAKFEYRPYFKQTVKSEMGEMKRKSDLWFIN